MWGHLASYFVISCLVFMTLGQHVEFLSSLPFLAGLLANLGGAALLWVARAVAVRVGFQPL